MNISVDYERALIDPQSVFGTPERLLADPRLDPRGKLEILRRWKLDAERLSVAEDEAMTGGEESMLARVQNAIIAIEGRAGR